MLLFSPHGQKYLDFPCHIFKIQFNSLEIKYIFLLFSYLCNSSKSKEKDSVEPVSEKKKVKEEKEDEKVEDVS